MVAGIKTRSLDTSATSDTKPSGRLEPPRERPYRRLHRLRLGPSLRFAPGRIDKSFSPSPSPNGYATRRISDLLPHSPA